MFKAKVYKDDVAWLDNGNLRDVSIKNITAGSNGEMVAVMTVPNAFVKAALGLK